MTTCLGNEMRRRRGLTAAGRLGYGLAIAMGALCAAPAHAVIASCSAPARFQADGTWNVESPTKFQKGTTLASINMKLPVSLTDIRVSATLAVDTLVAHTSNATTYPNFDSATQTTPVNGAPSIGGRLTLTNVTSTPLKQAPSVTYPSVFTPDLGPDLVYFGNRIASGTQRVSGQIVFYAKYELVVLDPVGYASVNATQISLARQMGPQFDMYLSAYPDLSGNDTNSQQAFSCFRGASTSTNTLASLPAVPTLPRDMPTCQFDAGLLNQTVTLGPTSQSKIAAVGDARSAGVNGEQAFYLTATACSKGASFAIYFTDAQHSTSSADYLSPNGSSGRVGVRLYHDTSAIPITFGAAPTGATLPPQQPIRYGIDTAPAGASYRIPFTAQYVLTQANGRQAVPPGPVKTMATVTVVYP